MYTVQEQGQGTIGTGGTTSTSTITSTILDSDQSLSVSREEEGVRSAISTEEESEVTRHLASPEVSRTKEDAKVARSRSAGKRMSLAEVPAKKQRAPLRTAMSVQVSERLRSQASSKVPSKGSNGRPNKYPCPLQEVF